MHGVCALPLELTVGLTAQETPDTDAVHTFTVHTCVSWTLDPWSSHGFSHLGPQHTCRSCAWGAQRVALQGRRQGLASRDQVIGARACNKNVDIACAVLPR